MKKTAILEKSLGIIPLGGLGEVGRNMILLEYPAENGQILIIDIGIGFPGEDMPGIDCLIPNSAYLRERKKDIVAAVFTHGHYDHIGAIPYTVPRIGAVPMFTSSLSKAMIFKRQEDFPNQPKLDIEAVKNGSIVKAGPFKIEFFQLNHNIPQNFGLMIETPAGNLVHTSDFKFDSSPVNDPPTDFNKLEKLSQKGILLLMSESTGAEEEGHSLSEKTIFENLEKIFKESKGRIISSTFASNLNRIFQLIQLSEKYQRRVVLEGRSMKNNIEISQNMKMFKTKKGTFIDSKYISKYSDSQLTILCTGAQGEEGAAFMRIANKEHKFIQIKPGDSIIFSSSIIPGNERSVQYLKDKFYRLGAKVYHYRMMDIHASGHARQDELRKMIEIMKPKFFMPIYGQHSMLVEHANLAQKTGINRKNIVVAENGQLIVANKNQISISQKEIPANLVMVDGLGIGDVGEVVLRDRQALAKDGMFVIVAAVDKATGKVAGSPDIISRGFVYLRESKELLKETRKRVINIINQSAGSGGAVNWSYLKDEIRNKVGEFLFSRTQRRPMVLPVIIEV